MVKRVDKKTAEYRCTDEKSEKSDKRQTGGLVQTGRLTDGAKRGELGELAKGWMDGELVKEWKVSNWVKSGKG